MEYFGSTTLVTKINGLEIIVYGKDPKPSHN